MIGLMVKTWNGRKDIYVVGEMDKRPSPLPNTFSSSRDSKHM